MYVNLTELLRKDFQKYEHKDYVFTKIDGVFVPITFGTFLRKADRFARFLLSEGFAGKRIMIYGENSVAWMIADIAIMGYVGVSIGAPSAWKSDDVDNEIGHLHIDCVLYSQAKADFVKPVMAHYPDVRFYPLETAMTLETDDSLCVDDLFAMPLRAYDACAKVVFSSGTTSFPKAVMLSQKNMFSGFPSLHRRSPFCEDDIFYTFLPLSHTYAGIYNFLTSLYYGFQIYLVSDTSKMATEIFEVNPTVFCTVPVILTRTLDAYGEDGIARAFGSRLRYLFVGGAIFSRDVKRIYKEKGIDLIEAYALSETSSAFAFEYSHDPAINSVGSIFEDIELDFRNVDEEGHGEIYCRGDMVFMGYMEEPEVTAEVLSPDGWFKTGDIGYVDAEGHLYITGRSKKLLLGPNGENINDERIRQQIREAVPEVRSVKLFLMDGVLNAYIYVLTDDLMHLDWDGIIRDINARNPKYDAVRAFKVLKDTLENRLKQ